jgi:hypothetical protein
MKHMIIALATAFAVSAAAADISPTLPPRTQLSTEVPMAKARHHKSPAPQKERGTAKTKEQPTVARHP